MKTSSAILFKFIYPALIWEDALKGKNMLLRSKNAKFLSQGKGPLSFFSKLNFAHLNNLDVLEKFSLIYIIAVSPTFIPNVIACTQLN